MTYTYPRNVIVFGVLLCMLAACQTTGPERIVTKEVRVPVAASCAVAIDRPDLPDIPATIQAGADIDALARVYRAYWLMAGVYIGELEAGMKGCGG